MCEINTAMALGEESGVICLLTWTYVSCHLKRQSDVLCRHWQINTRGDILLFLQVRH